MELNIKDVISFINDRLDNNDDVTVQDCCKKFNYSYYYFSRLFKKILGVSPSYYITALKMEKALALLLNYKLTVSEVYNTVQYQSASSFTRSFKKHMGLSPKEYKDRSKELSKILEVIIETKPQFELEYFSSESKDLNSKEAYRLKVDVELPEGTNAPLIFVGIYEESIALGNPIVGKGIFGSTSCILENVPKGDYYVFVSIIEEGTSAEDYFFPKKLLKGCSKFPVVVDGDTFTTVETMREHEVDLPVVINFPKLVLDGLENLKIK